MGWLENQARLRNSQEVEMNFHAKQVNANGTLSWLQRLFFFLVIWENSHLLLFL